MTTRRLLPLSLLALALAGCQMLPTHTKATPEGSAVETPTSSTALPGPHDNLNAVAWMQTSVEFRLLTGQTYRSALTQLDRGLKTPGWDALTKEDRDVPATGLPPAVIVDIDETVLDNSPYQARLIRDGKPYNDFTWNEWVQEQAAKAVPGSLEFARAATARGVIIYYISNRTADQGPATLANLRKLGFPVKDDSQFLGLGTIVDGCEDNGSEKGCRRKLVGRTHRVLLQFGDQIGDMVTVQANNEAGREQAVRPYLGWVGERWFVLPNPSYGSWEPALFNNEWSQPEGERRRQKIEALHY
ncbi:MAG TPA: 5'-nucleotidase, lipoprotein e(P4) family [Arenimonas sp.]|uniref:5'-nucleotidase, lipoprotein e(P4) family n=1 Tax=Arenimonas sp. TaxID=1872635 RepID=UPI002CD606E2|nr:5'-nucleotidase, lipoprotein e(P4) family [Arenimonas sp.]HMB57286.1 5'-nucleotidase, lipoprotein e(P4) family [Arenimonas sp.]